MKRSITNSLIIILTLLALTFSSLGVTPAYAALKWQSVGVPGFSTGMAYSTLLALDGSGKPYVAFIDAANDFKITVMTFDGANWVIVGTAGFSAGEARDISLALDKNGTPYVSFVDTVSQYKTSVMTFDGTNWVYVGMPGFSAGYAVNTSIALDGSGTPYVAFADSSNGYKAQVMKFDGINWVSVGTPGFSAGYADYTFLRLDGSGTPYVAFMDAANDDKATVMRFDGTNWVTVGTAGFSAGYLYSLSLVLDGSGTPYVAFDDYANGREATVMKFDGANWVTVGTPAFSDSSVSDTSLALDGSGTPYVAFTDAANGDKATVMKFDGANWVTVGTAGFSTGMAFFTALELDGTGRPYVVFMDVANGYKATVMKYAEQNYTVTFKSNGGSGKMDSQTAGSPTPLDLNAFTRTGYTFSGWNTAADGSGMTYANGDTYTFAMDITLYAQWTVNYFTVTFDAQGGSPTPRSQEVAFHGQATQPASPTRAGYTINGWYTAPTGGTLWDFDKNTITENITLYAQWAMQSTFSDVPVTYWSWSFIERLYASRITTGCGAGMYCPSAPVTRAQMAVFLLRGIHGASYMPLPTMSGGPDEFSDVSVGHWAAAWIKQLKAEGITTGCGIGIYCPEAPVTRDQMAVFLLRAKYGASYTPPAVDTTTNFTDVPTTHWAAAWIKQLKAEGITTGCGPDTYCPETPVTRDQIAVFLVRTFRLP